MNLFENMPIVNSIRFDPLISQSTLLTFAIAVLVLAFLFYRRYKTIVSSSYWWLLFAVKVLALIALFVLLLNPYQISKIPDQNKFNVVLLIDDTGSMKTVDCDGQSRIDTIKRKILGPDAPFRKTITDTYKNARFLLFAGSEVRRFEPDLDFETLPGDTDIDHVLNKTLENPANNNALGAVFLVSDGLDNKGASLMDAAKRYQSAGVPIHCIGVGNPHAKSDVGIVWKTVPTESAKNDPIDLIATVNRNFSSEATIQVELYENSRLIQSKEIYFEKGLQQQDVVFQHKGFTPGFKTYKIKAAPVPGEENELNNIDFAGIKITAPLVIGTLYFGGNLNWEYKYLRIFTDNDDKMNLDAAIRMGEKPWFIRGVYKDAEPINGFPEASLVNKYDCLIVNVDSLYLLDDDNIKAIVNFVENRGGGLIFTGVGDYYPPEIAKILPFTDFPPDILSVRKNKLTFNPSRLFNTAEFVELGKLARKIFLPDGAELYQITEKHVKPGSNTVMTIDEYGIVALAMHHYGAGKVAWLNIPDSWKWVMQLDDGDHYYKMFWSRLISWISSASRDRLSIKPDSAKLLVAHEQEFSVDVVDDQFIPDNAAELTCTVLKPDNSQEELSLIPDPKVDGRYLGKYIPRETGEIKIQVKAKRSSGNPLEVANDYLVVDLSPESEPHPMAEGQLQSLARQTGGEYWNYRQVDSINNFRLSDALSYIEDRRNWMDYWWFFAVLLLAVLPDWILRRRIGLR